MMASKTAESGAAPSHTALDFFDSLNLSHKIKSFISTNSTIPVTLIVSICVCILTLLIVLFVTIIFCMRKRNFKMCKNLIAQHVDQQSKGNNDQQQQQQQLPNRPGSGDSRQREMVKSLTADNNNNNNNNNNTGKTNKTFSVDVGCISAPLGSGDSISPLTNSTNSDLNHPNAMNSFANNTNPKKRTFTAALTATATNIISNSIGKYKINEILVTEDEEQQRTMSKSAKLAAVGAAAAAARSKQLHQQRQQDQEFTVDGMDLTVRHDLDTEIKLDTRNMLQQTNSSNTPSTAISNCSSNSSNNNNNHFLFDQHDHRQQQQLDMYHTKGMTLIDTFNSGSSSTNSASNSDPVAINNSLSSNSTAESPTYGYNVTSGATLNMAQQHFNNNSADHDNFFYIKANLSQQSQYQQTANTNYVQIVDEDSYVKTHHVKQQQSLRSRSTGASVINSRNHTLTVNAPGSNNSSNVTNGFAEPPESGYSTPSRHKKVVYEVIV
jgi:hypothetical protein